MGCQPAASLLHAIIQGYVEVTVDPTWQAPLQLSDLSSGWQLPSLPHLWVPSTVSPLSSLTPSFISTACALKGREIDALAYDCRNDTWSGHHAEAGQVVIMKASS